MQLGEACDPGLAPGAALMIWSTAIWLSWLALFGVLEMSAIWKKVPWTSMSQWTWAL